MKFGLIWQEKREKSRKSIEIGFPRPATGAPALAAV
jgi:hypothetical protein